MTCAYCGRREKGRARFAIHRDGFGVGPEVPLCEACGAPSGPASEIIWARIAKPADHPCAFKPIHLLTPAALTLQELRAK